MSGSKSSRSWLWWCWIAVGLWRCSANDTDEFNYDATDRSGPNNDYGPRDWNRVTCSNKDSCLGWPDTWELGRGWSATDNTCKWCPEGARNCGTHHQSPINLERSRGIIGHPNENECIDVHWMKYQDGTCTWDHLVTRDAFSIERFALRVVQPLERVGGELRLDCPPQMGGRHFGRIDFSKGFTEWWFLSHIDFHVPSEHTQDGKRYSAEAQMYHFYSVPPGTSRADNQLAAVTIFWEAYDDVPPDPFLDKLICQWRRAEEETRRDCNLPSVTQDYPGCVRYDRTTSTGRNLRNTPKKKNEKKMTAVGAIMENAFAADQNTTKWNLQMDPSNWRSDEDFDYDAFIESQYDTPEQEHRELLNYDHVGPWFNYFLMLRARTEYYFRYEGTQTIPPCYGPFTSDTRANTNHWRVLKDPARAHSRQIREMERLLANRIAPHDHPLPEKRCQPDTAGKPTADGNPDRVEVARPLQYFHNAHRSVFCECKDWVSRWREDRDWCQIPELDRYYNHPYNFDSPDVFPGP